jgi:hypothetical protein
LTHGLSGLYVYDSASQVAFIRGLLIVNESSLCLNGNREKGEEETDRFQGLLGVACCLRECERRA